VPGTFHSVTEAVIGVLAMAGGVLGWRGGERLLFPEGASYRSRRRRAVTQAARDRVERRELNAVQRTRLRAEGRWSLGIGIALLALACAAFWQADALARLFGDTPGGGF
jgi:hypothetical protein